MSHSKASLTCTMNGVLMVESQRQSPQKPAGCRKLSNGGRPMLQCASCMLWCRMAVAVFKFNQNRTQIILCKPHPDAHSEPEASQQLSVLF